MFCKECAVSNLISQKAGIENTKRDLHLWAEREEREQREARQRARERVISDFEKGMGLSGGKRITIGDSSNGSNGEVKGKGKVEMEDLAREAEERALKSIEAEQVEARKHKLAAFWLPSLAPEGRLTPIKDVKLETVCQAGAQPHPISYVLIFSSLLLHPLRRGSLASLPMS